LKFPDKYKDPNHKPEIAIALTDDFRAFYGFQSAKKIQKNLIENPALADVFKSHKINFKDTVPDEKFLKKAVYTLFTDLDKEENKDKLT